MGLLQPDQTAEPELSPDEEVDFAARELGEPLATYRAGGRQTRIKTFVGSALLLYGLIANYFWWVHGPAHFGHIQFHLLILPPILGGALLWFLYRNRGLRILVFPTGLLRLKPDEIESYPWDSVATLQLRTDSIEPQYRRNEFGELESCWLPVTIPLVQVWNGWFEIERTDATKSRFKPAVADYPDLARRVQEGTFHVLWPKLLAEFEKGAGYPFGDLIATRDGFQLGGKMLAWSEIKEVLFTHRMIQIKKHGSWRTWWIKEISQIPNPHLLFGLLCFMGIKNSEPEEKGGND